MIEREDILGLVPHGPRMCLIDRVLRWNEHEIVCIAASHRAPDNPLRLQGRLAGLHLMEYGAQAMAIHGSLLAGEEGHGRPGRVVAVRELHLAVSRLDDLPDDLEIAARKQLAGGAGLIYEFEAHHAGQPIGGGRISVMVGGLTGGGLIA